MRSKHGFWRRRAAAIALAALTAVTATVPVMAAEPIGDSVVPTYDEAYYATLDYYGNLTEGSVVKSYVLNGATALTDYGTYDEVVNLTDGTSPVSRDGATEFRFKEDGVPSHFYFEGKTAQPFQSLPWTMEISYTLNGVPTRAEDLAGKTGVVEIKLDILPNEAASDYARNNYTLEAMTVFNQDDILSLEAPGAQVQLIGNLRAVLFVVLPGEEQHFTIRVGSEDFSFGGMTFMMVPATLAQLEEIAKLSQRKDDLEEDYNKLSGSLDTLLNSFADLGGSLRATADGLDELNQARDTISSGKEQIYTDGDRVLEDLEKLNGSLSTLPGHLDGADASITEVTDALSDLTNTAVGLKRELDDLDDCLRDLQQDMRNIRNGTGSMQGNLNKLGSDLKRLQTSLQELKETLQLLDININGSLIEGSLNKLPDEVRQGVTVQGQKLGEVLEQVSKLEDAWKKVAVDDSGKAKETITKQEFLAAVLIYQGLAGTKAGALAKLEQVAQLDGLIAQAKQNPLLAEKTDAEILQYLAGTSPELAAMLGEHGIQEYVAAKALLPTLETVYAAVTGGAETMNKVDFFTAMLMLRDLQANPDQAAGILQNSALYAKNGKLLSELYSDRNLTKITGLLENLGDLLNDMGSGGLTGDLSSLVGKADTTLGHLDGTADVGREILNRVDSLLDDLDDLDSTINDQVPGLRDTLRDTKALVNDMVTTIDDTHGFLSSFRSLARTSGSQLDEGTKKSLENLAETLRKTARSTDAVGDVKTAKDAVTGIIEDTWHEYTGEVNNLLLMDATAEAQSLTSAQNPAPSSIQILIRTQEIKAEADDGGIDTETAAESTTFWGRVTQMFKDFWDAVTGIFQ